MPLYVYQVIEPDGSDGEVFEVMQRMSDPPLAAHPESGKPVRRLIAAPNAVTRFGAGNLSNDRLGRLGFTKYEKAGDGRYERTAGSGPDVIKGQ
ncbi:MAG TPA: zinc ribbon domain-containing protein [Gemmataceae bacterium]|nr:zinc ribbon domain-containing protein [Gemmataceae bacterium]